jgi:hypothetical protein
MALYLVKHDGETHANTELYYTAVAGGERSFMKMLAEGKAVGVKLFDQILYRVNEGQRRLCAAYEPKEQDLDEALGRIKKAEAGDIDERRLITVPKALATNLIQCQGFWFMKIRDLDKPNKYQLLPKLATARVCNCSYVALDAVNTAAETPIVVTVGA